jgi:signal transduction histidine kinase
MMRMLPRSIAGRTALVLIAGLLLVFAVGAAVWWMGLLASHDEPQDSRLAQRVALIAKMFDRLPPDSRETVTNAVSDQQLKVRWSKQAPRLGLIDGASNSRWAHRRLRRSLEGTSIRVAHVGFVASTSGSSEKSVTAVFQLSDGSWMNFSAKFGGPRPSRAIAGILSFLVIAGGIIGLAIWVSRRVTAPLDRFANAASRLGTDVDAPPLAESGPSEIKQAATAFNVMQDRIKRFVEDRTLMLAAISHDLRTILTRLRLRAEYIDDPEQKAKALADMNDMQTMLASTLSFARDDAAAETSTKVDLSGLLQTACDEMADAGNEVSFQAGERIVINCRPVALRRAVENLIDNAVKYGKEANVSLKAAADGVEIVIADRGPGIPPTEFEQVFSPFYRLERSRNRDTGGTGLGLAVARNIARRHGGDVTLQERAGGGLIARIYLPNANGIVS